MRGSPRNHPQQIRSKAHDLTLRGLLSLDPPAIVSLIFVFAALILASLILSLGYLPVGFISAPLGQGNMDRLVFTGAETPRLIAVAATVLLLAAPTFLWRIRHFRRILRFTTLAPGQISRLNTTALEFRVDYIYWFQQRAYAGHNAIRRNHRRERHAPWRPGQRITALVDSFDPEASIVLELHTRKNPGMSVQR